SGIAGNDRAGIDSLNDYTSSAHDAFLSNVRHNNRAVSDPAIHAYDDLLEGSALFPNRKIEAIEFVLASSTDNIHVAAYNCVVPDHAFTDRATRSDIYSPAQFHCGLIQYRPEFDTNIRTALLQCQTIKFFA